MPMPSYKQKDLFLCESIVSLLNCLQAYLSPDNPFKLSVHYDLHNNPSIHSNDPLTEKHIQGKGDRYLFFLLDHMRTYLEDNIADTVAYARMNSLTSLKLYYLTELAVCTHNNLLFLSYESAKRKERVIKYKVQTTVSSVIYYRHSENKTVKIRPFFKHVIMCIIREQHHYNSTVR